MRKFRIFAFVLTVICVIINIYVQNWPAVMGWLSSGVWFSSIIFKDYHEF